MGKELSPFHLYASQDILSLLDMLKADIANLAWSLSKLREIEKLAADRNHFTGQVNLDEEMRDMIINVITPIRLFF
jgi:hypothetical protein